VLVLLCAFSLIGLFLQRAIHHRHDNKGLVQALLKTRMLAVNVLIHNVIVTHFVQFSPWPLGRFICNAQQMLE